MARLSLVALLALAFSGVAFAAPPDSQEVVVVDGVRTAASWSYVDCGLDTDTIIIKSLEVSPDPPKPGQNLTVTVVADVAKTIEARGIKIRGEGAYADVSVKLGLIKLLTRKFDLCEEARKSNATVQCPVNPGTYTIKQTTELPKEIPPAIFNIDIQGYSVEDEDMFCLKLTVDFLKRFTFS